MFGFENAPDIETVSKAPEFLGLMCVGFILILMFVLTLADCLLCYNLYILSFIGAGVRR
jgi:hypothetical protein